MSGTIESLKHSFVKFIPDELVDGIVYISVEYKIAVHRCCCGCGEKVATPLSPAGWELTYNGETISLSPSISGGTCNSHYFIRRGGVDWVTPLTSVETAFAFRQDQMAAESLHGKTSTISSKDVDETSGRKVAWWRRLRKRLSGRQ